MSDYTLPNLRQLLEYNALPAVSPPPEPGWWAQAITSALRSGTSELVGLPGEWVANITGVSPEQNELWRAANPIASVGTQIAGALAPYGFAARAGWALGSRALPSLFSAERFAAAPVRVGLQRGVVVELPFAAGRTIASPILGGDMEQTALSAGLDIATGGVLGAGLGALWSRRSAQSFFRSEEERLAQHIPQYNPLLPTQERLRLVLAMPEGAAKDGPLAQLRADVEQSLRREVRAEDPDGPIRMVFENRTPAQSMDLLSDIYGKANDIRVRRFIQADRQGFNSRLDWENALRSVELPQDWEQYVQFPRYVSPKTEPSAKRLLSRMTDTLTQVQGGWYIGRGSDPEGLFFIAKRLTSGPPSENDRWFTGFTNRPSALIPDLPMMERSDRLGRFFSGIDRAEARRRIQEAAKASDNNLLALYDELERLFPFRAALQPRDKDLLANAARLIPENIKNLAKEYQPIVNRLVTHIKGAVAPTQFQFTNQPLARQVLFKASAVYDRARGRASQLLFGANPTQGKSIAGAIMRPPKEVGGVRAAWEALEEADIRNLARVIAEIDPNGLGLTRGAKNKDFETALREALKHASDNAQAKRIENFIRAVKAANDESFAHNNLVRRGLEEPEVKALDNRILPHYWVGTHRWRLLDERGRTVYIAAGRNSAEVIRNAEEAAKKFNLIKDPRGPFVAGRAEDLEEALLLRRRPIEEPTNVGNPIVPGILSKPRSGVGGYILDPEGPLPTKKELWEIVQSGIEQTEMSAADMVVKRLYGPHLAEIRSLYGKDISQQVLARLQQMSGTQGAFSAWQNKIVEKTLGFGKNGATKLASNLNRLETMFNLTFANFGYAALNAATPLLTLLPKLELIRTVPTQNLGRYFDTFIPLGPNGAQARVAHIPSSMKLMREGWRAIRQPDAEEKRLFDRALKEQVIAPRFIEQEVGLKSNRGVTIARLMRGEDSLYETAMNFIETPTRVIEEMTRAHAFATGIQAGRVFGMQGEALYQFAKELSLRTMYGYAAHDRPNIFQGPIGNVAGLFKTWLMHHIGDWSAYAGEAARRANFKPLLWIAGVSTLLGGLGGLPFIQGVDGFQRAVGTPGLMESLYAAMNGREDPWLADAAWYGLPGLFGISLQASAAAPFNDPTRDIGFMFSIAALRRFNAIGSLMSEALDTTRVTGDNPLQNERVWDRFWYSMTPRSIYKMLAQVEDGALKAIRNGAPIIEGISPGEYAMNVFGLTPTRIARAWEANSILWENRDRAARAVARYGEMMAQGILQNNPEMVNRTIANAVAAGVDITRVIQSAQNRVTRGVLPSVPFEYITDPDSIRFMEVLGLLR